MKYRPHGSSLIRTECVIKDCFNSQRFKGYNSSGQKMWDKLCDKHHRFKYGIIKKSIEFFDKSNGAYIPNDKCSRCGWDKGPCDRHRKIKELGYIEGNVVILCPNCHRLESLGIIDL